MKKQNTRRERNISACAGAVFAASDILRSDGMKSERKFTQHSDISCYSHSISVACESVRLARLFRVRVDTVSMVRGALLHDYFLYDWHDSTRCPHLHGFVHARLALENAERDFTLNNIEKDIIKKHMFPLNPQLPAYRESVFVTLADKLCAAREILHGIKQRALIPALSLASGIIGG